MANLVAAMFALAVGISLLLAGLPAWLSCINFLTAGLNFGIFAMRMSGSEHTNV